MYTQRMQRRASVPIGAALALVASVLPAPIAAGREGPADLVLALEVIWGDESMGPESLREEVERLVLRRLERSGCYASVGRSTPSAPPDRAEPDLRFRLRLSGLEVRERWDVSIAERTSPNQDPSESQNRVEATVGFDVVMDLNLLPEAIPLRTRSYRHEQSYRPRHNEDAREEVRRQVVEDLALAAASFACKRVAKLPREIERARSAAVD
jgi:hypothetical protein